MVRAVEGEGASAEVALSFLHARDGDGAAWCDVRLEARALGGAAGRVTGQRVGGWRERRWLRRRGRGLL